MIHPLYHVLATGLIKLMSDDNVVLARDNTLVMLVVILFPSVVLVAVWVSG